MWNDILNDVFYINVLFFLNYTVIHHELVVVSVSVVGHINSLNSNSFSLWCVKKQKCKFEG